VTRTDGSLLCMGAAEDSRCRKPLSPSDTRKKVQGFEDVRPMTL
jgi:hypothetical protein